MKFLDFRRSPLLGLLRASEVRRWIGLVLRRHENPIFQFLRLTSKRRADNQRWYTKGAPLIVAAIPVLVWITFAVYETLYQGNSLIEDAKRYAPPAFLVTAYIVWAATGLNMAILDALSLLRQSSNKVSRFELDDLTCATSITNGEFVIGFLGHALPSLYFRIVVGSSLGWLIMLLLSTKWFTSFSHDTWTFLALAPISIGLWSASGCLGITALLAFYLALGSGRSAVPAAIAGFVTIWSQGLWLMMCVGFVMILSEAPFGVLSNDSQVFVSIVATLLAPILVVLLVWFGLHIAFTFPVLKPIQAVGSPIMIPFFALVSTGLLLENFGVFSSDLTGVCIMSYVWHFGNMLPLNFGFLSFPVFYTGDVLGSEPGLMNLWYRPVTIALTQLVLLSICLGYAKKAVGQRRQAH